MRTARSGDLAVWWTSLAVVEEAPHRTGAVLRQLKLSVRDVRQASLCNDVLIALTARSIGAAVVTANLDDFTAIRRIERFDLVPG